MRRNSICTVQRTPLDSIENDLVNQLSFLERFKGKISHIPKQGFIDLLNNQNKQLNLIETNSSKPFFLPSIQQQNISTKRKRKTQKMKTINVSQIRSGVESSRTTTYVKQSSEKSFELPRINQKKELGVCPKVVQSTLEKLDFE